MPLEERDLGRLRDILDWGNEALEHAAGYDQAAFGSDRKTYIAVLHCIQIVGEAAWSLSEDFKAGNQEIPWSLIAGMRHRLVHDYGRIEPARIYAVIRTDLPELIRIVGRILDEEGAL